MPPRHLAELATLGLSNTLILLLQDKVPAVRDDAGAAITALGDPSIPPLLELLKHKSGKFAYVRLKP